VDGDYTIVKQKTFQIAVSNPVGTGYLDNLMTIHQVVLFSIF